MSHIVVAIFSDEEAARMAGAALAQLQDRVGTEPEDIVVVTRSGAGRVTLDQSVRPDSGRALGGGRWGALIGTMFIRNDKGQPGFFRQAGMDERFLAAVGQALDRGGAALGIRVRELGVDRVQDRLALLRVPGRVLTTRLDPRTEAALDRAAAGLPEHVSRRHRAASGG